MNELTREVIAQADEAKIDFEHWQAQRQREQTVIRKDYGNDTFDLITSEPQSLTSSIQPMSPKDAVSWGQLKGPMGVVISELRRTWRQEQAAAVAELIARLDRIETRLAQLEAWTSGAEDTNAAA